MSRTKQSVQRELKQQYKNLNRIEEKIAAEGGEIEASLRWLNQRDRMQERIVELEELLLTGDLPDDTTPGSKTTGLGKLHYVPELPPHYLPRSDDLTEVKAALLAANQPIAITGATRKVGLQGMGGIGKSVLAAALAYDDEVRQAFPDGIFWLTLGQEPNLTTRQAQLAESVGDPIRIFGDVQQGRARLSELLAERTCLLILDDVWQAAHAEAFNALGPQGRLLLTSRDAALIRAMGAAEHRLGVLSQAQALELLAYWAAQPLETLPPEAKVMTKACGYLPLALAMLGAQVRGKPDRWANVLHKLQTADLAKIRQAFPHYPYPNLLLALQVSVEALEPELRARYLELAVFPEDTPIPEAALQTLWATEGMDEYDVQDVTDTLVDRSLARRDDRGRLSLHDLQYDYVRRRQAGDLTALHGRLVAAYRQKCANGWTNGPDDGYFFDYLAYHLAEAGQREELYALISKTWMDAQFKRTFSHRAFADDVERAIAVAGAEEPPNLVQVIRDSLIYATLGELATNVPPEILGVLAQVGQVEQALGYASLIQDAEKQSLTYRLIGEVLLQQGERTTGKTALEQAAVAAKKISEKWKKDNALKEIAKVLIERGESDQALMVVEEVSDEDKASILSEIHRVQAETTNNKIEATPNQSELIQTLIKAREFDRAFTMTKAIEAEEIRLKNLANIAYTIAGVGEVERALAMTEMIEDNLSKVAVLWGVANVMIELGHKESTKEIFDQVLIFTEKIEDKQIRTDILRTVIQFLAEDKEFERALAIAETITTKPDIALALCTVAQSLAETGEMARAIEIIDRVFELAKAVESKEEKASVLMEATKAMAKAGLIDRALAVVEAIEDGWQKRKAVREVAKVLIEVGAFDQALTAIKAIEDSGLKNDTSDKAAKVLIEKGEFDQVLTLLEIVDDEGFNREVAKVLVNAGEFDRALVTVEAIEDKWQKNYALSSMVVDLAKMRAFDQALAAVKAIEENVWVFRPMAVRKLAKVLTEVGAFDQILSILEIAAHLSIKIERLWRNWSRSHSQVGVN